MILTRRCGVQASMFFLMGCAVASAATFNTYTDAEVNAGGNSPAGPVSHFGSGPSSSSLDVSFGNSTFSGLATADATFGVLKVGAFASVTNYDPMSFYAVCTDGSATFCGPAGTGPVDEAAISYAGFTDSFTVTGGSGTGYLQLSLTVDGTTSFSSDDFNIDFNSNPQGGLSVYDGALFQGQQVASVGFFGGSRTYNFVPIQFTYGVPHTISILATAEVYFEDASVSNPYTGGGSADFTHTISVSGVGVYNDAAATQAAGNYSLTSASGTAYPLAATPTPEPSGMMLMMAGLGCCAVFRVRLSRRSIG